MQERGRVVMVIEAIRAPKLIVNSGVLKEVQQFCYLGDVPDCEAGVERAAV